MELFAADGHDAGGCERVTGKSGMRPRVLRAAVHHGGVHECRRRAVSSRVASLQDAETSSAVRALHSQGASARRRLRPVTFRRYECAVSIPGVRRRFGLRLDPRPRRRRRRWRCGTTRRRGPAWGYGGSGPAQLALVILLTDAAAAERFHPAEWSVIAPVEADRWGAGRRRRPRAGWSRRGRTTSCAWRWRRVEHAPAAGGASAGSVSGTAGDGGGGSAWAV